MQSIGADLKTRRETELEHPCHFNAHLQNFKAFMKSRFLNKKFREIRSIIDILEEIDNLSLLEAGYIDRVEKVWKRWISYTRERFPIVFRLAKDNFLPKSFSDNTANSLTSRKSIYQWASTIDHIKVTIGIINYMSINPGKNRYKYKDSKILRIRADSNDIEIAKSFFSNSCNIV